MSKFRDFAFTITIMPFCWAFFYDGRDDTGTLFRLHVGPIYVAADL